MATNNGGVGVMKVVGALALALLAGGLVTVAIKMGAEAMHLESAFWSVLDSTLALAAAGGVFWWLYKRWLGNAESKASKAS